MTEIPFGDFSAYYIRSVGSPPDAPADAMLTDMTPDEWDALRYFRRAERWKRVARRLRDQRDDALRKLAEQRPPEEDT